ncbi:hypothetical protein FHR49_003921 [Xanthomonas campestris]
MISYNDFIECVISEIHSNNLQRTVEIGVISADSTKKYHVKFENVFDMIVDGMRLNNIIDEFEIHRDVNNREVLSKLNYLLIGDHSEYICGLNPHVDSRVADFKLGKLKLWEFSPNYGGFILILGERCSFIID